MEGKGRGGGNSFQQRGKRITHWGWELVREKGEIESHCIVKLDDYREE